MVKNLKFGKKFAIGLVTIGLVAGSAVTTYQIHRNSEISRVKTYLEDFITEDNYVDLSCIDKSYGIEGFKGEYLREALQDDRNIKYVRIDDKFIFDIYDGVHVGTFKIMAAYNEAEDSYYDPIKVSTEDGVEYLYPEGYKLVELELTPEPYDYERLDGTKITVDSSESPEYDKLKLTR